MANEARKTSQRKLETNDKYLAKLDRVTFRLHKDGSDGFTKDDIEAAAAGVPTSVNSFIIDAIRDKL